MDICAVYQNILPKFPEKIAFFILRLVNWFFQGLLFASKTELIIKILIDLVLTLAFTIFFINYYSTPISFLISFIVAHSLNWIFATNIWSTRIKKYRNPHENNEQFYIDSLYKLQKRVKNYEFILGVAIYGSLTAGKFHLGSDVDVKIVSKPGFKNIICSYLLLFSLRTNANFKKFPLDIYVINDIKDYDLKKNEIPIILYEVDKTMSLYYKNVESFGSLTNMFASL
ncbi:nucleotidyltransferase domain-containing protein [Methanosarcina sp. UBA289]|uniref:nucleotidyltransferase domain-containing protein n=1 Tax=Methanosarcina sp. UBA289 TaxID=1915574 RepID=UPI0025FD005A|nr:nucleotidyltransferase domain-containing protein [Methanosarcina sp. UBA289]